MRILSLNLHSYQEKEPIKKLKTIADTILEQEIDVICFSECAQRYFTPLIEHTVRKDNAAYLIQQSLKEQGAAYELRYEPVHLGYFGFVEGLAVLSRYPILRCESFYVSEQKTMWTPNTRKAMEIILDGEEPFALYNVHLGFDRRNPFTVQFEKIHARANQLAMPAIITGDFNLDSASQDYMKMLDYGYIDTYSFNPNEGCTWQKGKQAMRIDYTLIPDTVKLQHYSHLFKDQRVSDHFGIMAQFSF